MTHEEKWLKENHYSPSLAGKKFEEMGNRTLLEFENDNMRAYISYLGSKDGIAIQMSEHEFCPGLKWYQKIGKWIMVLFMGKPKLSSGSLEPAEDYKFWGLAKNQMDPQDMKFYNMLKESIDHESRIIFPPTIKIEPDYIKDEEFHWKIDVNKKKHEKTK